MNKFWYFPEPVFFNLGTMVAGKSGATGLYVPQKKKFTIFRLTGDGIAL